MNTGKELMGVILANCNGKINALPNAKVALLLQMRIGTLLSERELRAEIQQLRLANKPIGSCPKGYFWATKAELKECILEIRERLESQKATEEALVATYKNMP
jgi:hypothetical protein